VSGIDGLTYYGPQGVRNRIGVFRFGSKSRSGRILTALETGFAS